MYCKYKKTAHFHNNMNKGGFFMISEYFHNGINIGGWLSQYEFLVEVQDLPHFQKHFDTFITEKDIHRISQWGLDHVRIPVSGYLLYDPEKKELNPIPLSYLDQCISWCKKYGLNMILDLHDLWGNVYGAMDKPMPLLTDHSLQDNFFDIWKKLTRHFEKVGHNTTPGTPDTSSAVTPKADSSFILMFELLNEVSDASLYLWNQMYKEAIKEIRKIDPKRPILVGSNCQNSVVYLNQLDLVEDPLVFYNFHYYDPQVFTHQRAHFSDEMKEFNQTISYPGDISGFVTYLETHPQYQLKYALVAKETRNDRALMEKLLKNAMDFVTYSGKELYCGEFGVIDSAPDTEAVKWLKDFTSILDQYRIGHALWNYKALDFGLFDLNGNVVSQTLIDFMKKI